MGWIIGKGIGVPFRMGGSGLGSTYWETREPKLLIAYKISNTEVVLLWSDRDAISDYYNIYVDGVFNQQVEFGVETATLTGLALNVEYEIKLTTVSGARESDGILTQITITDWFVADLIPVANVIAAYNPVGAASLEASKVNLANPGTFNAGGGVDSDWDSANGWKFDGATHYYKTGIVPVNNQTWSMMMRFTGFSGGGGQYPSSLYETALKQFGVVLTATQYAGINGKTPTLINGLIQSGILGICGAQTYLNGRKRGVLMAAGTGAISYDLYIGAAHYDGAASNYFDGEIQAEAVYNKVLSEKEAGSLTVEMKYIESPVEASIIRSHVNDGFGALLHYNMSTFTGGELAGADIDVDTFAPTGLDIDQWLDTCVAAGMKYAILTAKHWDGFCLWPTKYTVAGYDPYSIAQTSWYAANGNPDIIDLFVKGCRERGLKVGIYFNMNDLTWEARTGETHATDPVNYNIMIQAQVDELISNYGRIDILWFDMWTNHVTMGAVSWSSVFNAIRIKQPYCLVSENAQQHPTTYSQIETYEVPYDTVIPDGNGRPSEEVNTLRNDSKWFYDEALDHTTATLYTAEQVKAAVTQANARTGTYLLGIYPDKAGKLTDAEVQVLTEIGNL